MPRDYKYRARKKPQKKPLPGWLWLLTGLLLGGFIVGLVWLRGQAERPGGEWIGAQPDRPPQGAPAPKAPRVELPPPKPRFDFYDMLPEMEVAVPDEPFEPRPPPPTPAADARYLLQIGSFRDNADADRVKAQLALLGIEAEVVGARIGPQDTRYRVRSGPYSGRAAVDRVAKRLADNGFTSLLIPLDR
ncbi:MAG: SPOR domain-containing protein [Gammaproteobacteria bacterium]|nr:SPOR domain-containing protein [Gammaproteobacteria bacterium]